MGDISNRARMFGSVFDGMMENYQNDVELDEVMNTCHWLLKHPELPIHIGGGCYLVLASLDTDYLHWAQLAVEEYQFGMDHITDEEKAANPEGTAKLHGALKNAQEVLEKAEQMWAQESGKQQIRCGEGDG